MLLRYSNSFTVLLEFPYLKNFQENDTVQVRGWGGEGGWICR